MNAHPELGVFVEGFNSLARLLATDGTPEQRWKIFGNVAIEVAGYVAKGMQKQAAIDWLQSHAESHGYTTTQGQEAVQEAISRALA